ncbi:MAG: Fic family protein [Planctomycetaceae bacterium]
MNPAIESGLIGLTMPESPQSRLQRYRLTARGRAALMRLAEPS